MLSRVEGRNYIVLDEGRECVVKFNKNKTDKALSDIHKAVTTINSVVEKLYEDENYDLYYFVTDILHSNGFRIDDGRWWIGTEAVRDIEEIQEILATHNDEIPKENTVDSKTLEDFGFRLFARLSAHEGNWYLWQKVLEEEELKEVVEEVYYIGDEAPVRRIRTILYEKTDYGKSSTDIKYTKKPIGKKLAAAIENTRKRDEQEKKQ